MAKKIKSIITHVELGNNSKVLKIIQDELYLRSMTAIQERKKVIANNFFSVKKKK